MAHEDHPGHSARLCPLSYKVNAKSFRTMDGYGCAYTGGHCNPSDACDSRRINYTSHEEFLDEMDRAIMRATVAD